MARKILGTALTIFLLCHVTGQAALADPSVPFEQWLAAVKQDAVAEGVSPTMATQALTGLTPDQEVIRLDMPKNQPEISESFAKYAEKRVSQARIDRGREMLLKHYDELRRISGIYGVAPQYIVALWGMETNYGSYTGRKDTIRSLATLGWHGRGGTSPNRASFFRKELITALKIMDEGHIGLGEMKGSWAGAFGQVQFMPSSFHRLAVDGDGDGRKDIWHNLSDAFASAGNYLTRNGWNAGERWGRQVRLPAGFSKALIDRDVKKSLAEWQRLGVMTTGGQPIPVAADMTAHIVAPDGLSGGVYLVYNNFNTIKRWNNSDKFALSVGLLADSIATVLPDRS